MRTTLISLDLRDIFRKPLITDSFSSPIAPATCVLLKAMIRLVMPVFLYDGEGQYVLLLFIVRLLCWTTIAEKRDLSACN